MAKIKEKHKEIFDFLMEKHQQNPDMRFLLRSIDRGNKLQKGYWFHGGNEHVSVSFWNAWTDRYLSIEYKIENMGDSEIILRGIPDPKKEEISLKKNDILGKLANLLDFKQGKDEEGNLKNFWTKKLDGKNYLKNLENFISFDKPVIDSLLKSLDKNNSLFSFITKEKFDVSLARTKNWQMVDYLTPIPTPVDESNLLTVIKKSVKLLALRIENIKRFSSAYVSLDSPIVCFYGKNGTGKTTLLRSIAVAMAGEHNLDKSKRELKQLLKIKNVNKDKVNFVEQGKLELIYTVDESTKEKPNYNSIIMTYKSINERLNIENNGIDKTTKKENKQSFKLNREENDIFKTLMIGFAQQVKDEQDKDKIQVPSPNINDLEYLIYDISDSRFQEFVNWVGDKLSLVKEGSFAEREANREQINDIFKIINEITSDGMMLSADSDSSTIRNKSNPDGISLELMSQGYQNVIGWVGFFIKRLWEVAQIELFEGEDFTQMPAICLIDEIDTYLHPEWQYRILSVLSEKFKNVQFIVTSHSPFVLSSIPHKKTLKYELIEKDGEIIVKENTENLYGAQINHVAEAMGTTKRLKIIDDKVEGLLEKIYNNQIEEAKVDLAKLAFEINNEDSDLRKAMTLIKTKEILKQRSK